MTTPWSEPCAPSDVDRIVRPGPDGRPFDIHGQGVSREQWLTVEDVPVGEWL